MMMERVSNIFQFFGCCVGVIVLAWFGTYLHDLYVQRKTVTFYHPYLGEVSFYKHRARTWVMVENLEISFAYTFPMPGVKVEEKYVEFLKSFLLNYQVLRPEFGKCAVYEFNKILSGETNLMFKQDETFVEILKGLRAEPELFIDNFELSSIESNADGTEFLVCFDPSEDDVVRIEITLNRKLEVIHSVAYEIT